MIARRSERDGEENDEDDVNSTSHSPATARNLILVLLNEKLAVLLYSLYDGSRHWFNLEIQKMEIISSLRINSSSTLIKKKKL